MLSINLKNVTRVEQDKLDDTSYYFGLICAINEDTKNYLDKINTYISVEDNNSEVFLLGFRSKNKDLIIKWIVILNYLIQNYKWDQMKYIFYNVQNFFKCLFFLFYYKV